MGVIWHLPPCCINTTQHKPTPVRWARHLDKPEHGDTRHVHMTTSHVDTCVGRQLWCWGCPHTIEHPPHHRSTPTNAYIDAARDRPIPPSQMSQTLTTPICSPASPAILDPTQTQTLDSTLQELTALEQEVLYQFPRLAASLSSRSYGAFEPPKLCGILPPKLSDTQ